MFTRKNSNQKNLAEIDEENGDFSNGSDEEWTPESGKIKDSTSIDSQNSSFVPEDDSNSNFDTTTGFTLKILKCYMHSKHPVYSLFGLLMKNNLIINRVKDRFFCSKCFNENKFKR